MLCSHIQRLGHCLIDSGVDIIFGHSRCSGRMLGRAVCWALHSIVPSLSNPCCLTQAAQKLLVLNGTG